MADTQLSVDYQVVNSVITQLESMTNRPEDIFISIGKLRMIFEQSNGDCSNVLKSAINEYEEIYRLVLKLANNSISMLETAKIMYTELDETMRVELETDS